MRWMHTLIILSLAACHKGSGDGDASTPPDDSAPSIDSTPSDDSTPQEEARPFDDGPGTANEGDIWDNTNLTWCLTGVDDSVTAADAAATLATAAQTWTSTTRLTLTESSNCDEADIIFSFEDGDGARGTLAWATHPSGGGDVTFDAGETWTTSERTSSAAPIDLETVALHELGHALGLGHADTFGSVMTETYAGSRRTLSEDDEAAIQALYGEALTTASIAVTVYAWTGGAGLADQQCSGVGPCEDYELVGSIADGESLDVPQTTSWPVYVSWESSLPVTIPALGLTSGSETGEAYFNPWQDIVLTFCVDGDCSTTVLVDVEDLPSRSDCVAQTIDGMYAESPYWTASNGEAYGLEGSVNPDPACTQYTCWGLGPGVACPEGHFGPNCDADGSRCQCNLDPWTTSGTELSYSASATASHGVTAPWIADRWETGGLHADDGRDVTFRIGADVAVNNAFVAFRPDIDVRTGWDGTGGWPTPNGYEGPPVFRNAVNAYIGPPDGFWRLEYEIIPTEADAWAMPVWSVKVAPGGESGSVRLRSLSFEGCGPDIGVINCTDDGCTYAVEELPDFSVGAVSAPSSATEGDSITMSGSISNVGDGSPSSAVRAFVVLSTDTTVNMDDTTLSSFDIPAGDLGSGSTITFSESVPLGSTVAGDYYIGIYVDGEFAVSESEEGNNANYDAGVLTVYPTAGLPLTVGCGNDHPTLQDAVDAASNGDTITLCAGTFSGATVVDGKTLTIVGDGEASTYLTASAGTVIFIARNSASVAIADLSIRDGNCSSLPYCGLYVSSATADLSSVTISNITGMYSPGLKANSSAVTLDHVTISTISETGGDYGAGLSAISSTVTATDSVITGNTASSVGGGVYAEGSTIDLTDTLVSGNVAGGFGGGLYIRSYSSLTMSGGEITFNQGINGGGVYLGAWSTAMLDTVDITFNEATGTANGERGGAFYIRAEGGSAETSAIEVISGDFGSGASENLPLDVEVQDTSSTEDFLDYSGMQSFVCSVPTGTCQ